MARIVIAEFMDEGAVEQLRAVHDVLYDPLLVDQPSQLLQQAATADVLIVRNRTQVRDELLAALSKVPCHRTPGRGPRQHRRCRLPGP
jgi:(S)-sulfolactate dehydrogenase